MRAFFRLGRTISAATLFFFCWSYLPLYMIIAQAATPPGQKAEDKGPKTSIAAPIRYSSNDRFEKALEDIRINVGKAEKRVEKGEDDKAEREQIRAKRAEIDSLDVELRKEFTATEKQLRDAGLSQEIVNRHAAFVKHYEANLQELKANLDDVDKATTATDKQAKLAKTKAQLEKTKSPSKHIPLDLSKLPHRTIKTKEWSPRGRQGTHR